VLRPRAATALAVLALVLVPASGGAADAAAHKKKSYADLVVAGGLLTTYGGNLTGTVTVTNKGTKTAKLSTTSLAYAGQVIDEYPTLGLKPGKSMKVKVDVPAPDTGSFDVRACADAGNKTKEKNEKNNCATISVDTDPLS
jgi:archaellum component FlaF (FlaF/FlaG flagellin family)